MRFLPLVGKIKTSLSVVSPREISPFRGQTQGYHRFFGSESNKSLRDTLNLAQLAQAATQHNTALHNYDTIITQLSKESKSSLSFEDQTILAGAYHGKSDILAIQGTHKEALALLNAALLLIPYDNSIAKKIEQLNKLLPQEGSHFSKK